MVLTMTSTRRRSATPAPLVVFCHGLFGQGRNWTSIGNALAPEHRVLLVDLPDHGRSGWSDRFDYVASLTGSPGVVSVDDPVALVGHSMGGKVAMLVALQHPELVERLVVVDVSPVAYDHPGEFGGYIDAMQHLDLETLERRSDADAALREAVPEEWCAASCCRACAATAIGWAWRLNLDVLGRDLRAISDWPEDRLADVAPYDGPVLWVGGAAVAYVGPSTSRPWIAGSPATAGSPSRTPATGCTRSSRRSSSRCCAGSSLRAADGRGRPRPRCGCRRRSAEAPRPVAGEVEHDALAVVVGADVEPGHLVGADHVDHRHRGLDGDPGDSGASSGTAWMCQSNGRVGPAAGAPPPRRASR